MSLLAFIFVVGIIFAFVFMKKATEITQTNEAWMKAAGKLGLAFTKAKGLLDFPNLHGTIEGIPVSVAVKLERRGNGAAPCTIYSMALPEGSNIESILDKAAAHVETVRTGHPEIDKLLASTGFDRAKIRALMAEAKDAAIEKFVKTYPNLSVTNDRITLRFEGIETSGEAIANHVAKLTTLAKALAWHISGKEIGAGKIFFEQAEEKESAPSFQIPAVPTAPPPLVKEIKSVAPVIKEPAPIPVRSTGPAFTKSTPMKEVDSLSSKATVSATPKFEPLAKAKAEPAKAPAEPTCSAEANAEELVKALFSATFPGQAEKALFEKHKGQRVSWSGTLKSAQEYGMDFNFGGGAGTKAVIELCEVQTGSGMKVRAKAILQLPKEAAQQLKGRNGQPISFSGSLFKFEPISKEIYLANGSVA